MATVDRTVTVTTTISVKRSPSFSRGSTAEMARAADAPPMATELPDVPKIPMAGDGFPSADARSRAIILVIKHQGEIVKSSLTITLSEARYRALKEAAAQRSKTIGQLIDESLDFYGIKSRESARDLVRRARAQSQLSDDQALAVAQEHVRAVRRKS